MLSDIVKKELKRVVGDENASFSKEDLVCYSYDATNTIHMPEAVLFPRSAVEISLVLKMANSEGFPVVPRGAGTGFTGGSLAVAGGVVLSTERMNTILDIDTENLTAVVEPGVVTGRLQQEVEALGLFYPPDPTSLKVSTIGGNIAECAGGPRGVKYGVTRDYVLGMEVVLPTGEIITTGVSTMKGVVGYDLTRLIIGSEGTLGVVTKATLRLIPKPECTRTMLATFIDSTKAAGAATSIITARHVPSVMELMDEVCVRCVEEYAKSGIKKAGALLLVEVDGTVEGTKAQADAIQEVLRQAGAVEVKLAANEAEAGELWKIRRAISPALRRLGTKKINEDVVVPRSAIAKLITGIQGIAAKREVTIASFGHAGDGNIHVNVMLDKDDAPENARGERAVRDIFELTVSLGGTISGEHGVGTSKAPYLGMELTPAVISLMRGIKQRFDPNNILNPGKIFSAYKATEGGDA